jgi:putative FmdB family regulatory protein
MPIYQYTCNACGYSNDYIESFSVSKENYHPDTCPNCGKGKMIREFDTSGQSFDVKNGSSYHGGKKDWKRGKTQEQVADILSDPTKNPY